MTAPLGISRRVSPEAAAAVRERDGGRCVGCGALVSGDRNKSWAVAKRIPAAPRGTVETDERIAWLANLIVVCGYTHGCHRAIEAHPAAARARGLRLWRSQDPLTVPVWTWTGPAAGAVTLTSHITPYYLDNTGRRAVIDRHPNPLTAAGRIA